MAEIKNLPTTTYINYKSDGTVDIILNYNGKQVPCNERMPHILSVNISDVVATINGISVTEGELYSLLECYPEWIQTVVDANGNFVIVIGNPAEDNYYINENTGQLWYDDTM